MKIFYTLNHVHAKISFHLYFRICYNIFFNILSLFSSDKIMILCTAVVIQLSCEKNKYCLHRSVKRLREILELLRVD